MIRKRFDGPAVGRAAALAAAALMALALLPSAASAHAKLTRSEPRAKARLEQAPRLVELWFSDALAQGFSTIEVTDAQGGRVDSGPVTHAEGDKKAQVGLQELGPGAYTVTYKVVSVDEHTIRGKFTFTVAEPAAGAAATSPTPAPTAVPQAAGAAGRAAATPTPEAAEAGAAQTETAGAEESATTWVDNLVRWLAYLAMMTLLGGFAARLFVLGPALRRTRDAGEGAAEEAARVGARRAVSLLGAGLAVLVVTLLAALALQSAAVNGVGVGEALSPALLGRVVTQTGYGRSWLFMGVAAAALAVVVLALKRELKSSPPDGGRAWWWAGLAASGLMLVGPSLTGHTMAAAREHHFAVVSDWLHLFAGGFWVGGLFHLALTMPPSLAPLGPGQRTRALGWVITLFTRVAVPSVVVVSLAGLYNSWIHLGSLGALWGTPYGKTLLVKVLLVVPMVALGALNGFRFGPLAERLGAAGDEGERARLERGFVRSLKVEAALGVLVLLVAAVLVFVTPGRNDAMEMTGGSPASPDARAGGPK